MDMLDLQTYGIIQIKSIEKKKAKYNVNSGREMIKNI